jgi:pyrroline-5-carboxylate reductase
VSVAGSNQAVVDQCDVVFLCVVPQVARRVVEALVFRREQTVISVIASLPADEVAALVAPVPRERICCAIPLPAVSVHKGATIILPNPIAERIFSLLGTAVVARTSKELEILLCVSCMMGPFYETCGTIADWLVAEGVPPETASDFVCGFHDTVLSEAQHRVAHVQGPAAFQELVGEQTPGGLNEANVRDMTSAGTFATYRKALATTLKRLRGEVELTEIDVAE